MVSSEEQPLLDAYDLSFHYAGVPIWSHVDLALYAGDIGFLIGPNGAGKTTLLKCLAGWMAPSAGEIRILSEPLCGRSMRLRSQIAFVSDVPAFYDDLTAREHIDFLLRANRMDAVESGADELLEAFGIADACGAYPSAFSRGMREKLALVVALMMKPKLLLLDEPTGPLDPPSRELLGKLIKRAATDGTAVLLSCHHDLPHVSPDIEFELSGGAIRLLEHEEKLDG